MSAWGRWEIDSDKIFLLPVAKKIKRKKIAVIFYLIAIYKYLWYSLLQWIAHKALFVH